MILMGKQLLRPEEAAGAAEESVKGLVSVRPELEAGGGRALENANRSVKQNVEHAPERTARSISAGFGMSDDERVAKLAGIADVLAKRAENAPSEKIKDAVLMRSVSYIVAAETLSRVLELPKKNQQEPWAKDFVEYAESLVKKKDVGPEDMGKIKRYYVFVGDRSAEINMPKHIDYFENKLMGGGYKGDDKKFMFSCLDALKREGSPARKKELVSYMIFYERRYIQQNVTGEGKKDVQRAMRAEMLGKNGTEYFMKGLGEALVFEKRRRIAETYEELKGYYVGIRDAVSRESKITDGRLVQLGIKLDYISQSIKRGNFRDAEKRINGLASELNKYVRERKLGKVREMLTTAETTVEALKERMHERSVRDGGFFKDQYGGFKFLMGKISEMERSIEPVKKVLKKLEDGKKLTESDEKAIAGFSQKFQERLGFKELFEYGMSLAYFEKQYRMGLKESGVRAKKELLKYSEKTSALMDQCLKAMMAGGEKNLEKARTLFMQAVERKMWIFSQRKGEMELPVVPLAKTRELLDKALSGEDLTQEWSRIGDAYARVWDSLSSGKGAFDKNIRELMGVLSTNEATIRGAERTFVDDVTGAVTPGYFSSVVSNSNKLIDHYLAATEMNQAARKTAMIDYGLNGRQIAMLKSSIKSDAKKLGDEIQFAKTLYMVADLAASIAFTPYFLTSAGSHLLKEQYVKGEVSAASWMMVAAAAIGMRHYSILSKSGKMLSESFTAAKVAGKLTTGAELGLGGYLVSHGIMNAQNAKDYAFFALPLIHAFARKPIGKVFGKISPHRVMVERFTSEGLMASEIARLRPAAMGKPSKLATLFRNISMRKLAAGETGVISVEAVAKGAKKVRKAAVRMRERARGAKERVRERIAEARKAREPIKIPKEKTALLDGIRESVRELVGEEAQSLQFVEHVKRLGIESLQEIYVQVKVLTGGISEVQMMRGMEKRTFPRKVGERKIDVAGSRHLNEVKARVAEIVGEQFASVKMIEEAIGMVPGTLFSRSKIKGKSFEVGVKTADANKQNGWNNAGVGGSRAVGDAVFARYIEGLVNEVPAQVNARLKKLGVDSEVFAANINKSGDEIEWVVIAKNRKAMEKTFSLIDEGIIRFEKEGFGFDMTTPIGRHMQAVTGGKKTHSGGCYTKIKLDDYANMKPSEAKRTILGKIERVAAYADILSEMDAKGLKAQTGTAGLKTRRVLAAPLEQAERIAVESLPILKKKTPKVRTDTAKSWYTYPERGREVVRNEAIEKTAASDGEAFIVQIEYVVKPEMAARITEKAKEKGKGFGTAAEGKLDFSVVNNFSHKAGDEFGFSAKEGTRRVERKLGEQTKNGDYVIQPGNAPVFEHFYPEKGVVTAENLREIYASGMRGVLDPRFDVNVKVMKVPKVSRTSLAEGTNFLRYGMGEGTATYSPKMKGIGEMRRLQEKVGFLFSNIISFGKKQLPDPYLERFLVGKLRKATPKTVSRENLALRLKKSGYSLRNWDDVVAFVKMEFGEKAASKFVDGITKEELRAIDNKYSF